MVQQNGTSETIEVNGGNCTPVAPIATTTAININGDIGDESVVLRMFDTTGATIDWGTVNWTINLGSDVTEDFLGIPNNAGDDSVDIALGASGIDLNNDGDLDVTLSGTEEVLVSGGPEDDTISAAGSTATGAAFPTSVLLSGNAGDDTLAGGAGNDNPSVFGQINGGAGDDTVSGGAGDDLLDGGTDTGVTTDCSATGGDWVDFSASTAAVNVNLTALNATGEGLDTLAEIENITGSAQADTLTGDGADNEIAPGAGDDKVDGSGATDTVDYSDATAAVTVDFTANTATGGSGNDTLTSIENAHGSDFDDTFVDQTDQDNADCGGGGNDLFNQGASASSGEKDILDGEGGTDTADYGARTSDLTVTLNGSANKACPPRSRPPVSRLRRTASTRPRTPTSEQAMTRSRGMSSTTSSTLAADRTSWMVRAAATPWTTRDTRRASWSTWPAGPLLATRRWNSRTPRDHRTMTTSPATSCPTP